MARETRYPERILEIKGPAGTEQIAMLQRSEGDEVFLAFPGISMTNKLWFWDSLWSRGEVQLAGLPGHGPVRRYPRSHYQRWTTDHFQAIGIAVAERFAGRPLTLIGHSTGGMVALLTAQARPDLVKRLILVAPVVWGELGGSIKLWTKFADRPATAERVIGASLWLARRSPGMMRLATLIFAGYKGRLYRNPSFIQAVAEGFGQYRGISNAALAGTSRVIGGADLRPLVRTQPYVGPTLLIHGTNDGIVPFSQSRWLAATLPNAYLAAIPGAGHLPFGEREALVNRWIADWLALHPIPAQPGV